MFYQLEDFRMDLRKTLTPDSGVWVTSGYSTCAPRMGTVTAVKGCFSPPFAAPDELLEMEFIANNHTVVDTGSKGKNDCGLLYSGGEWFPDRIVRRGTYHWQVKEEVLSFSVESELIPLADASGFVQTLRVNNREQKDLHFSVVHLMHPGHPKLTPFSEWGFAPPEPSQEEAVSNGVQQWENSDVRVSLLCGETEKTIPKEDTAEFCFAVFFTRKGELPPQESIENQIAKTKMRWETLLQSVSKKVPQLVSNIPGMESYWKRSLLSGLICLWENQKFVTCPFPACCGIDGGAICAYPWDVAGYSARTVVMLLGEQTLDFFKAMLHSGIDKHISMAVDGTGLVEYYYSYSMWSIINLYWNILLYCDKGWELFDTVVDVFKKEEARLPEWEHLKDYGGQHNLLEMRSRGYEHIVPSPNAERAWCYDCLAQIGEKLGRDFSDWHKKATQIRQSIQKNLWDEDKEWFYCRYPDNHHEFVYSVQMFNTLKYKIGDEKMRRCLLRHICEGDFVGEYGVSSISAKDAVHYELNDNDWSGGGSYTGSGPTLAEILWQDNEAQLAWDVLRREFWMGKQLLYYPQEHSCDVPKVPENKRANIISGVTGLQALLFGMAGINPMLDGSIEINPHPLEEGSVEINGFIFRNRRIDLKFQPGLMEIKENEKVVYRGEVGKIII